VLLELRPDLRDLTQIVPVGITAQAQPSCLSQPDRVPACVVTAPLVRDSGVDRLLRSLQTIVRSGQEVQLFLLSSGPAERTLRRLVETLGILHYVTFAVDMRAETMVEDAMRGADLYIMPGVRRRFTATRLTALACGLAIIAPRGTSEDYLIDGTTAMLFDPDQPDQLTEAWLHLLDDRTAARRLAETALDYARAHHQATKMATSTAGLYQEIHRADAAMARIV
jgi:glycosyltransferase involved in cell wall biosynthesis